MEEGLIEKIKMRKSYDSRPNTNNLIKKLQIVGALKDENNRAKKEKLNSGLVIDIIRGSYDKLSGVSSNQGFVGFQNNFKKIKKLNLIMRRKLMAKKSLPYRVLVTIKDICRIKILGKEGYSIEDIFNMQSDAIENINSNLSRVIIYSRNELDKLVNYRNNIIKNFGSNIDRYKTLGQELKLKSKLYLEAKEEFESMKQGDKDYSTIKLGVTNLERELKEMEQGKILCANYIKDRGKEEKILEDIENLLRTGVHICEMVNQKTGCILEYVRNTKKKWDILVEQGKITEALYESVGLLGEYSGHLHTIVNESIGKMAQIASNPNIINSYYLRTNKGIRQIANNVIDAHYNSAENLENNVNELLKG